MPTHRMSTFDEKWNMRFYKLAEHIASWSKDPSSKHGAVIVNHQRVILSHGYNGFARGVDDDMARYEERSLKYKMVVHAEANALINANGRNLDHAILVCTGHPCVNCAPLIIQAGIKEVVCPPLEPPRFEGDWMEDAANIAVPMFQEASVYVTLLRTDRENIFERELNERCRILILYRKNKGQLESVSDWSSYYRQMRIDMREELLKERAEYESNETLKQYGLEWPEGARDTWYAREQAKD